MRKIVLVKNCWATFGCTAFRTRAALGWIWIRGWSTSAWFLNFTTFLGGIHQALTARRITNFNYRRECSWISVHELLLSPPGRSSILLTRGLVLREAWRKTKWRHHELIVVIKLHVLRVKMELFGSGIFVVCVVDTAMTSIHLARSRWTIGISLLSCASLYLSQAVLVYFEVRVNNASSWCFWPILLIRSSVLFFMSIIYIARRTDSFLLWGSVYDHWWLFMWMPSIHNLLR